jgi:hypothetical protein
MANSANRNYPMPGALTTSKRLADMQIILAALAQIDVDMHTAITARVATSQIGATNGVAQLVNGVVPSSQLPSFVDDVIEAASLAALPAVGESGKIYLTLDTTPCKQYRWSGSAYSIIEGSPGSTDAVTEGATNLYFTAGRAAAAAPVQSVAGRTGAVVLTTADIANCGTNNIPQVVDSGNRALILSDSGKHILHPSADTTARTYTIPANSAVAYDIGTGITFVNQHGAGALTIACNDTMYLAGAGSTGSRALAANGVATALKVTATEWIISGTNLT